MIKRIAIITLMTTVLFISATVRASVGFDFAADTQGWAADDWGNGLPTLSWTSFNGGSLQADTSSMSVPVAPGNWAKVYLKGALATSQDLTSIPVYSLDIWVPSDMWVKAKLGVRTGGGWTLYQGLETADLTQSTWQTISWDLSGTPGLNDVKEVGVEVFGWYPTPTGNTFNIDNASANASPIPEPASLLLLGTGLVGIFVFSLKRKGVK